MPEAMLGIPSMLLEIQGIWVEEGGFINELVKIISNYNIQQLIFPQQIVIVI